LLGGVKHLTALVFIRRSHNDHAGNTTQQRSHRNQVWYAIGTHNPCPIDSKDNKQIL
jgi:hypothetical protein